MILASFIPAGVTEKRVAPTRRQLAASILMCAHIADREAIAGFLTDPATQVGGNPFPGTSVGAQRQTWTGHSFEFRTTRTEVLGLTCLLRVLGGLPGDEPLVQDIFQSGPCRAYVYHFGDGCRVVGSVLHAKPGVALPIIKVRSRRRRPTNASHAQLDLFAIAMPIEARGLVHEHHA